MLFQGESTLRRYLPNAVGKMGSDSLTKALTILLKRIFSPDISFDCCRKRYWQSSHEGPHNHPLKGGILSPDMPSTAMGRCREMYSAAAMEPFYRRSPHNAPHHYPSKESSLGRFLGVTGGNSLTTAHTIPTQGDCSMAGCIGSSQATLKPFSPKVQAIPSDSQAIPLGNIRGR